MKLLGESDKPVNSLLHFLEFNTANYQERGKITTQLYRCLQERRRYKDFLAARAPIVEFLNQNKNLPDKLGKVPGSTRRKAGRPRVGSTSRVLSLERAIPGAEHDPERSGGAQDG